MSRLHILRTFFLLWFCAVLARLYYWQVIRAVDLSEVARRQYERPVTKNSERGEIFFADGHPLVLNTIKYTLIGKPNLLTVAPGSVAKQIVTSLALESASPSGMFSSLQEEVDYLTGRLADPEKKWVTLLPNLSEAEKKTIELLGNAALTFETAEARSYPEGSSSAHLLGFVGKDINGDPQGYFGIEGEYDLELQAKKVRTILETDAVGHPIGMNATHVSDTGNGRNLELTVHRDIQYVVERLLRDGIEKYGAKAGDVVVMNPVTGEVIASSSFPSYDPASYSSFPQGTYKNPVVADAYEPGSTFKVLTVSAGVDAGVISPETECDSCAGPVTIGQYTIKTWDNKYHAHTTIQDGLTHSDNTAMVFVGRRLGKEKFLQYIKAFGIGEKTGIDLQDEGTPKLRDDKDWSEIDTATATFGQGIALTPIQMLNGVNAIANGGKLMKPYVVKKVFTDTEAFPVQPQVIRQVIQPETAKIVTHMMQIAASTGDAKWTLPKQYPIAGKTGTAQIPVSGHYDETRTIASFVGFAPADNPQFSMIVRLVEPSTSQWGSETAAPLWFSIAKELFFKYGITPNK